MSFIIPPYLKPGSTIAITCPSGYLPAQDTVDAKKTLEDWGFNVLVGETVGNEFHYFSGDDQLRQRELQAFLDHPEVDAIIAGRGGYGLSRIIDGIDFTKFEKKPKWVIGFSDITVLHSQISTYGIQSIHGPMCRAFKGGEIEEKPWLTTLKSILTGEPITYLQEGDKHNVEGFGKGILTGGNLCMLAHQCGSVSQIDTKNKILFIEEIGEYLYSIDRMLMGLKRAGVINEQLEGLICGGFSDTKDTDRPFGATVEEIILDKVKEFDFPVCFNFSAGHIDENFPIILGKEHELSVSKEWVKLHPIGQVS